jgi:lactoylglutathione lyase
VTVPATTETNAAGNREFSVRDPNGHRLHFVEYAPDGLTRRDAGQHLPSTRIAPRMSHAGLLVGQLAASLRFYGEVLGCVETWRGGAGPLLSWVNLRVPDGQDYLEFMLYDKPPTRESLLGKHHICLEVPSVPQAADILRERSLPPGVRKPDAMKVGVNGKRQVNCYDPDGTRVEIMEPTTVDGRPVPPSAAPPPPALPPYDPTAR